MCLAKITKSTSILRHMNVEMPAAEHHGQVSVVAVSFHQQQQKIPSGDME
jgi:hypothetical protein